MNQYITYKRLVLRGKDMEYTHPYKYKGLKFDTPNNQGVLICTSPDATDDCWNPVWPEHFCSYGE